MKRILTSLAVVAASLSLDNSNKELPPEIISDPEARIGAKPLDLNGDGNLDLIKHYDFNGQRERWLYLGNGSGNYFRSRRADN